MARGWLAGLMLSCAFVQSLVCAELPAGGATEKESDAPHGRLETLARSADLIFKGQVISDEAKTNASFVFWAKPHVTVFKIISVLQGKADSGTLQLWHYTGRPMAWGGPQPPSAHSFAAGQTYIIYADTLDKAEYLYEPPADAASRSNEFRQFYGGGVTRTLDARPIPGMGVKEAHWFELNLLLQDSIPTNVLYAIDQLDSLSLTGRGGQDWGHYDDFKRNSVLSALLPLVTSTNETIANRAIGCFASDSKPDAMTEALDKALIQVANEGPTSSRRLNAIGGLSGRRFPDISNSLTQLLQAPDEQARAGAVDLLAHYPGRFSDQALLQAAGDDSPWVRSCVANVIGNGKYESLLPTLVKLFADPVGLTNPLPPLTMDSLQAGARADSRGDVHTCAGYALLNFDLAQVGGILKANRSDKAFQLSFMKRLAEDGVAPDLQVLAADLLAHTANSEKEAAQNNFHWPLSYWLTGNFQWVWDTLFAHVSGLSRKALDDPKMVPLLDALQIADDPGDAKTRSLYEFFLDKGLLERAILVRRGITRRTEDKAIDKNSFGFPALLKMFDDIDEKHSLKPGWSTNTAPSA